MRLVVFLIALTSCLSAIAQTNYQQLENWVFHPGKSGTLIDGFNLDIAVVDENLATSSLIKIENNAMKNTGVDVFFVHPTILPNMSTYTEIENVSIADQNALFLQLSIRGQAGLLAKYGRMYAPKYRQATPPTFISSPLDEKQADILGIAYNDVKDAFLHYLETENKGNKIIIASHSQGAYLAGFLLRELFDENPQLQEKLVVAVIAGIASNYFTPDTGEGGWWKNVPFCNQPSQCGCVMNWRTYKEGQTPTFPQFSHPCLNPNIVENGWAYRLMNLPQDWFRQDSLYYDNQSRPLRNFITLKNNLPYGGNAGYVAFDSLYSIRHQRSAYNQVGLMVQHTPKASDQRPNLLEGEEPNPLFPTLGYHVKDYNIYTWALLEQIDFKLASCLLSTSLSNDTADFKTISCFPNPTKDMVHLKLEEDIIRVKVLNTLGQMVKEYMTKDFSVLDLPQGVYHMTIETENSMYFSRLQKL
jgi:hypothetical protein